MKVLIISGRAGSGKSVVLQTLEDMQFYCVDNIPPILLSNLLAELTARNIDIAISIDARNLAESSNLQDIIHNLNHKYSIDVLYLDANDETLLRRFKETRRRHPLTSSKLNLKEALVKEHQLLSPLKAMADLKIDTSNLKPQQLRQLIHDYIHKENSEDLSLLIESFGYKYGIPTEADFIFDVRCLPNPYWDNRLRDKTGLDQEVIDFLQAQPSCQQMLTDIKDFLLRWLPAYQAEQRKYLTIAIGCTGGVHRSVYLANELAKVLKPVQPSLNVRHRELP